MSKFGYLLRTTLAIVLFGFALSAQASLVNPGSESGADGPIDLMVLSCGSLTKSEDSCQIPDYSVSRRQFAPDAHVPEPGSLVLFAIGMIGYGLSRRRR